MFLFFNPVFCELVPKANKSDLPSFGFWTSQMGNASEFWRPMDLSGSRANPRRQSGGAKVHRHTSGQVLQPRSVYDRFTKIEARSNVSVRLDARVIESRAEINLAVALDGRAPCDCNASFDFGRRADVTGRLYPS